jgi:soluble cytochrome b562
MLSESRKNDREKMANAIEELADEFRFKTERDINTDKEISILVECDKGLRCFFTFDGQSQQKDVFVNSWNIAYQYETKLNYKFPGEVNRFHRRKSTTVCYGFDELMKHIEEVFSLAKAGDIFES